MRRSAKEVALGRRKQTRRAALAMSSFCLGHGLQDCGWVSIQELILYYEIIYQRIVWGQQILRSKSPCFLKLINNNLLNNLNHIIILKKGSQNMDNSWNDDIYDIRDVQVLIPLPTRDLLSDKEVKIWIGKVFKKVLSIAFKAYYEEKLSLNRASIFCSENILKNMINLHNRWPLNLNKIKMLDHYIHYELLPFLKTKYPMADECTNENLTELLKQVDLNNLTGSNYIEGSDIKWKFRQSGIYNDLIMSTLNHVLRKIDEPSEFTFDSKGSNYEDFKFMMNSIFERVEDYEYMVLNNGKLSETVLLVYKYILELAGIKKEQIERYQKQMIRDGKIRASYDPWSGESITEILQKKESYAAKVKEYTSYSVSRKVPEGIELYTDKEIQSMNITFKSPAILRIIQKWYKELIQKFDKPNYFSRQLASSYDRSSNVNSLLREDRMALDQLIAQQFQQIRIFMERNNDNNYKMQELLLKKDQHPQGHEFIDELEWKVGIFSLDLIKHFHNYLVTYLNRLIHGLLKVAKNFYNNQSKETEWSSPPNLITFTIPDLMRCKFNSKQKEIMEVIKNFQNLNTVHSDNRISFLQIKNRLSIYHHDLSLIFKFNNDIICEVQLTIEKPKSHKFIKLSNQFSHYLYELQRSTFGPLVEISNVWVSIDSRFEIYEKLRKRTMTPHKVNFEELSICSNNLHQTSFKTDSFICDICKQVYSHNYYIKEHRECSKCHKCYCAKCYLMFQTERNPKSLMETYIIDVNIRESCSRIFTLSCYKQKEELPDLGVCIEIESQIPRLQYFHLFVYQASKYLLGLRNDRIYEIEKVNSEEQVHNFLSKYLIFEAKSDRRQFFPKLQIEKAKKQYILPEIQCLNLKKYDFKITISEGFEDKDFIFLFQKIQEFNRKSVKQILLDNNKITNVDIVTDYFPNLEFLELSKNPITNYSTLDKLKHLKHLQLSHCGLREVPQNIYNLKELQKLKLSYNNITAIDKNIQNLQKLQILEINNNKITFLPHELENCQELIILRCEDNELDPSFKLNFANFQRLQELNIGKNQIRHFLPGICELKNLKVLKMSKASLKQVAEDIGSINSLVELDLQNNNLSNFKVNFAGLNKLKKLSLAHNLQLNQLPSDLGKCSSLEELYLDGCNFSSIPPQTNINSLKILVLKSNNIRNLSESFGELKNIEELDLSKNPFQVQFLQQLNQLLPVMKQLRSISLNECSCCNMPTFSICDKLQTIRIKTNFIKEFGRNLDGLNHLTLLDASSNQITEVDQSIVKLQSLIELDLSSNKITRISILGEEYKKWPNLETLNLSCNRLQKFPNVILLCSKLRKLNLSQNNIKELPPKFSVFFIGLEVDISKNDFEETFITQKTPGGGTINLRDLKTSMTKLYAHEAIREENPRYEQNSYRAAQNKPGANIYRRGH